MDKTVTGSVADIRAPNIRHSTNGSLYMRYVRPPRYLQQNPNKNVKMRKMETLIS